MWQAVGTHCCMCGRLAARSPIIKQWPAARWWQVRNTARRCLQGAVNCTCRGWKGGLVGCSLLPRPREAGGRSGVCGLAALVAPCSRTARARIITPCVCAAVLPPVQCSGPRRLSCKWLAADQIREPPPPLHAHLCVEATAVPVRARWQRQ